MRNYSVFVIIISVILFSSCEKKKELCPKFFPVQPEAKLNFISYVTNQQNEILYPFEYFERRYLHTDTLGTKLVHHCIEKNNKLTFYTDEHCTIWHRIQVDLSALTLSHGFTYQDSVYLSFWKPVIKVYDGINTEWNVKIDTTFSAFTSQGIEHILRYEFSGMAQYKGWSEVFVPENREKKLKVRHVHWNPINYLLFDQTSNDTLYAQNGTAHDFFEPEVGLVRSTFDYDLVWKGKPKMFRKSTWELFSIFIPNN